MVFKRRGVQERRSLLRWHRPAEGGRLQLSSVGRALLSLRTARADALQPEITQAELPPFAGGKP